MKLKDLTSQSWEFYFDHREVLEQGVLTWYKDCPYPYRGYHDNNMVPNFRLVVLERLGIIKKYLFNLVHLSKLVFPWRFKIKAYYPFLYQTLSLFEWVLGEYLIKDEEFSVSVWEIGKAINRFLCGIGLSIIIAAPLARYAMMILEFDNAYLWRLQDLIGIISLEDLIKDFQKEITRVLNIYLDREILQRQYDDYGARGKILRTAKLLKYLLYIPKFKRALKFALQEFDIEKAKFDDNDRFHFAWWYGYNFEGKTRDERFEPYAHVYKKLPYKKRDDPQALLNFMMGQ